MSGKNCSINIENSSSVTQEIKKLVGENHNLIVSIMAKGIKGDTFSPSFLTYVNKDRRRKINLDLHTTNKTEAKKIAKLLKEYYYSEKAPISATSRVRVNDVASTYGYSGVKEREEALRHSATFIIDEFTRLENNGVEVSKKLEHYGKRLQNTWKNIIFEKISALTGKSKEVIKQEYEDASDKADYIDKNLGEYKGVTEENLYAVYKELFGTEKHLLSFINEVFNNPALKYVRNTVKDELNEAAEAAAAEATPDAVMNLSDDDVKIDTSADDTLTKLNNHIGLYSSFMAHVGSRLFNYFNSLRKQQSVAEGDLDTSTTYGIAETMDANACSSMIYNSGPFTNIRDMINKIRQISKNVAGYEAFAKFANDLESNLDFATEVWTVFSNFRIGKFEVDIQNGSPIVKVSNLEADPARKITFGFNNDLVFSTVALDHDEYGTILQDLLRGKTYTSGKISLISAIARAKELNKGTLSPSEKAEEEAELETAYIEIRNKLLSLFKQYYPSLQDNAFLAYCDLANDANGTDLLQKFNNLNDMITLLADTAKDAKVGKKTYITKEENRKEQIAKHKKLLKETNDREVIAKSLSKIDNVTTDFVTRKQNSNAIKLQERILPYSIVNTRLNSKNIDGNSTSNIIHNSWITEFQKMLEQSEQESVNIDGVTYTQTKNRVLEEWVTNRLRSKQFKNDPRLFEQKDENGNIINKGTSLFYYVGNQLMIRANVADFIGIEMFDGSSQRDNGKNMAYHRMTMGDFLPSAYMAYHNVDNTGNSEYTEAEDGTRIDLGRYFLRIPSDAPQAFVLKSVKYNTRGLFANVKPDEEINATVEDMINNTCLDVISMDEYRANYQSPEASESSSYYSINEDPSSNIVDIDRLESLLFDGELVIGAPRGAVKYDKGSFDITSPTNYGYANIKMGNSLITVYGNFVKRAGRTVLTEANIMHLVNYNGISEEFDTYAKDALRRLYRERLETNDVELHGFTYGKLEKVIDRQHPVFAMFRNAFKQELIDAATALNSFYELEKYTRDGKTYYRVALDNSNPKNIKAKRKEGIEFEDGYDHYHYNGSPVDENGALTGYVFHSSKFTLTLQDAEGNNVNRNFLDELLSYTMDDESNEQGRINLLYGAAQGTNIQIEATNDDGNLTVTDVVLSPDQLNAVDSRIEEFLREYQTQAIKKINDKREFIPTNLLGVERITDYAINSMLTHYSYDTFFEGSPKFYKGNQDILKRAKEYQGSGISYGMADFSENGLEPNIDEEIDSFLNTGIITEPKYEIVKDEKTGRNIRRKVGTTETPVSKILSDLGVNVRATAGFKAITVKNTKSTNKEALDTLVEILTKTLSNEFDEDRARQKAIDLLYGSIQRDKDGDPILNSDGSPKRQGGFVGTKVNDAQSYITFEEFIRRIAGRGQLLRHLSLIRKLADPNAKLTGEDIKEFVQVQKNFYFDHGYDDKFGIYAPRQIKNAEFVLIPKLIKGTQLEEVYNMMKAAGIAQLNTVETSKAANKDVLTLWDDNGKLTIADQNEEFETHNDEKFNKFVEDAKNSSQIYYYKNLYTQQETPQHMNAMNKAGIQIVKKIIDNIGDEVHVLKNGKKETLKDLKTDFAKCYSQNIIDAFSNTCKEFGVKLNEDGNIELDDDNSPSAFDNQKFLDRLKEEFIRTGIDDNLKDYVELDGTISKMPSAMNNVLTKFEQAVQSIFNANITRQKLPGFHAAQITNIGWSSFRSLSEQGLTGISYDKNLKYHPDGKGYIEVMLPASYLGIDRNSKAYRGLTDAQILAKLEEEGLDFVIGYRIPTEGKQSVCNMKVVGFIDDSLGSTIVVPNDWVSQTGSDFDIDSVYGIQPEVYKSIDGGVHLVRYKKKNEFGVDDYVKYVKANAKEDEQESGELKKAEEDAYAALSESDQNIIKAYNAQLSKEIRAKGLEGKEAYLYRLVKLYDKLGSFVERENALAHPERYNFVMTVYDLYTYLDGNTPSNKIVSTSIKEILDKRLEKYQIIAEDNNLNSYEEWLSQPEEVLNSQKARNTRIFEVIRDILASDEALEENLSRSNFDDLIAARDMVMDSNMAVERKNRSPYNPFDQMAYQEDAMSGRALKGISVSLDTFCSVCNAVKPTITYPITVIYPNDDFTNYDDAAKSFNKTNVASRKNGNIESFSVIHDSYGWSNNNRNISGKILTSYSSQTTAYILDAIKEGSMPNVNTYTFPVFKTLVNMGIDYRTAAAFIMQPGVTRIINAYNTNQSVFSLTSGNPIEIAIRDIAEQLNIPDAKSKTMPVEAILKKVNEKYKAKFNKYFKLPNGDAVTMSLSHKATSAIPLNVKNLIDRVKERNSFKHSTPVEDKLIFDLGVILSFHGLHKTGSEISNIARVCNPDKFGAKESVYATKKVFDDIDDIVFDREDSEISPTGVIKKRKEAILTVGSKHILEAIYPSAVDNNLKVDDIIAKISQSNDLESSSYRSLYAFLKYVSATSCLIGKKVFETQDPTFVRLVNGLESVFTAGHHLTEEQYNDFQKYILESIYKDVPAIKYPVTVRIENGNVKLSQTERADNGYESLAIAEDEAIRVRGYNIDPDYNITIADVNNPTNEELEAFEELSPAQKVDFIKKNFGGGVFDRLEVNLYNGKNRGELAGMHSISFIEDNANANVVFNEFKEAFYNNNPLIVSTAIDIVKYAAIVEGFRMRTSAINKIISNEVLLGGKITTSEGNLGYRASVDETGLGFVGYVRKALNELKSGLGPLVQGSLNATLYENYLRSHPDCTGVRTVYATSTAAKERLGLNPERRPAHGVFILNKPSSTAYLPVEGDTLEETKKKDKLREDAENQWLDRLERLGVRSKRSLSNIYDTNKYVRIKYSFYVKKDDNDAGRFVTTNNLYKIVDLGDTVVLYPLSNLNKTENSSWSTNESLNDGYLHRDVYEALIDALIRQDNETGWTYEATKKIIQQFKDDENKPYPYYQRRKVFKRTETEDFDIKAEESLVTTLNKIVKHFSNYTNERLVLHSPQLSKFIHKTGEDHASRQTIELSDGTEKVVEIRRANWNTKRGGESMNEKYLRNNEDLSDIQNESAKDLIEQAKSYGAKELHDVYVVTPIKEDVLANASTGEEISEDAIKFHIATRGNNIFGESSINVVEKLRLNGVEYSRDRGIEGYEDNSKLAMREVAKACVDTSRALVDKFNAFIPSEDELDRYHKASDDEVFAKMRNDDVKQAEFLELINSIDTFKEKYEKVLQLEPSSDDADITTYIEDMNKAFKEVNEIRTDEAKRKYVVMMSDKISTNPLIKSDLIDVFDNYWKTYGGIWQFTDIRENGNPLIQILMKDIVGDMEAKRHANERIIREHRKRIKEIYDEAKANGEMINIHHVINDDNGTLAENYSQEFVQEYNRLLDERNKAATETYRGSIEHLKAVLAFDEFKAKHINQPAQQEYYIRKCELMRDMLFNEDGTLADTAKVFSEYKRLEYEMLDIYDYAKNGTLTKEQEEQLNKLKDQQYNLYRENYYIDDNNNYAERPRWDSDVTYSQERADFIKFWGISSANKLKYYKDKLKELNDEYFEDIANYGFKSTLDRNLKIVESYEKRDINGIPSVPQSVLYLHPDYVKAKEWIRQNAYFDMPRGFGGDTIADEIHAALTRLSRSNGNKVSKSREIMENHENPDGTKGIKDEFGVIDGTKLSDDEIESIKLGQYSAYYSRTGTSAMPEGTDRVLISNARPDDEVYNAAFYRGMSSGREHTPKYYELVTKLNAHLEPLYNQGDGLIHFEYIEDTPEGRAKLIEIGQLYQALSIIRGSENRGTPETKKFIEDNVEFVTNEIAFEAQVDAIKSKVPAVSDEYKQAMIKILYEHNEADEAITFGGKFVPNKFLFSYAKPKAEKVVDGEKNSEYEKWVDHQRRDDLRLLHTAYRKQVTRHYERAKSEALREAQEKNDMEIYRKWYSANHIYNPYTRKMEPLDCWVNSEIRYELYEDYSDEGSWAPRRSQRERKVRTGKTTYKLGEHDIETYDPEKDRHNDNYKEDEDNLGNYIVGSGYDNNVSLNESEKKLKNYLKEFLLSHTRTNQGTKFFKSGNLPIQAAGESTSMKMVAEEFGKMFGFGVSTESGRKSFVEDVGFGSDFIPENPMTQLLRDKNVSKTLDEELETLRKDRPTRGQFAEGPEGYKEFNEAMANWNERYKAIVEKQTKISNDLRNKDWLNVIENYIENVNQYNSVLDNKQKIYFLLNALRNQKAYAAKYGLSGEIKAERTRDDNLIKQYEDIIRRLLFDQWKKPEDKLTRIGSALQGFTSANYMMMNFRGGIANVTLGETGILAEMAAGQYMGKKEWLLGKKDWVDGCLSFGQSYMHMLRTGEERSFSKQDAIIKRFLVVDYDEKTGVVKELNLREYSKKLRDFMFSPQTMGEHYMQNSVLFAMLHSHKLITMKNGDTTYMNYGDFIRYKNSEILEEVLTDEQKAAFTEFKNQVKENKSDVRDYAWFRKDLVAEFMLHHCDQKQREEYIAKSNAKKKALKQEFDAIEDMYSQMKLGDDGHLAFVEGSKLADLDSQVNQITTGVQVTDAEYILGRFTDRVRSVNNKIHGVYNRLGRAYIEHNWWGSLVMQYHKHLPIGILKRWSTRGYYNEARGTEEVGIIASMIDFCSYNFRTIKHDAGLTEENLSAIESLQFFFTHLLDFANQVRTSWNLMPEYVRANVYRNLGDFAGVAGALATTIALWYIAGDDDDIKDNFGFNLALYEADRLSSEAGLYNPIGLVQEGKKILTTPIAAQSIVTDVISSASQMIQWLTNPDYDMTYKTGRFAGENRLSVYIQRRIPMWSSFRNLMDITKSNHYYKIGRNTNLLIDAKGTGLRLRGIKDADED